MKAILVILIYFSIILGGYLLTKLIQKVLELLNFYKYIKKLKKLESVVNQINTTAAENELMRLNISFQSTADHLKNSFHISLTDKDISTKDFIEADANSQKSKRRRSPSKPNYYRRRFRQ
jgi:biopolymer transport protein ExbB/TolQ